MILGWLRALVRRTPEQWRALVCRVLVGHLRRLDVAALCTVCDVCGTATPGVALSAPAYHVTQVGDPRRVETYARQGIVRRAPRPQPEPLDDDWFSDEHFQGGFPRVS